MPQLWRGYWEWIVVLFHMRSIIDINNYARSAHDILEVSAPV